MLVTPEVVRDLFLRRVSKHKPVLERLREGLSKYRRPSALEINKRLRQGLPLYTEQFNYSNVELWQHIKKWSEEFNVDANWFREAGWLALHAMARGEEVRHLEQFIRHDAEPALMPSFYPLKTKPAEHIRQVKAAQKAALAHLQARTAQKKALLKHIRWTVEVIAKDRPYAEVAGKVKVEYQTVHDAVKMILKDLGLKTSRKRGRRPGSRNVHNVN